MIFIQDKHVDTHSIFPQLP